MDENREIQIERYILETMSAEEKQAFEEQLALDPQLKKDYESTLAARQLIVEAGRMELKETMEEFETESDRSVQLSRVMPLWVKRALPVAALVVLFFAVYQFTNLGKAQTGEAVYSDYFEPYAGPGTVRNGENGELVNWKAAAQLYKEGNYAESLALFRNAEGDVPGYLVLFYVGMSAMSMDPPDLDQAIMAFDSVMETDNDYVQQADWYKALALLRKGDNENAMELFKDIFEAKTYNHTKAAEILELEIEN